MLTKSLFFSALLASAYAAAEAEVKSDVKSDVEVLSASTFKDFITKNDLVLAEFYAPWCGHCKALAPEYEKAATELLPKNIRVAKVDCTEESELCQEHGIEGYPTLKVFRGLDSVSPYNGQRKADNIISYMIKQSLPSVSLLTTDSIEKFKTADKVVIIAYFDNTDKTSNETFTAVADKLRDNYLFGATSDASLAKAAGVKAPGIVVYKTFDDPSTIYSGDFKTEDIVKFAKSSATPLIGEVGPETYSDYMAANIPLAYLFVADDKTKTTITEFMKELAKEHKGKINFATIDANAYGAHASNLNLKENQWPAFAIQDTVKNLKYPYDQEKEITKDTLTKFVKEFVGGSLKPSIKSEAKPEKQEGPVHVIVAHNYEEIVMDKEKDVLVEFYAPWCGHCKSLAPKYEELGALYFNDANHSKKVTIAKVDATANDVPDEIQGFPTIKLYPAGKKTEPIDYSGNRNIEDLAKFVKEHGTHKVDVTHLIKEEKKDDEETLGKAAPAASEKDTKDAKDAKDAKDTAKETTASETVKPTETPKVAPPMVDDIIEEMHDEL